MFLFTTCALCALFLLWRRASALRGVVAHQCVFTIISNVRNTHIALRLTSWPRNDGRIRLSMDEGPSAREFLDDDYDEDHTGLGDDEPLAVTADRLQKAVASAEGEPEQSTTLFATEVDSEDPPPPPPKASPPVPPKA